jgi:uncharacterized protein (UPF0332 family)
MEQFWRSKKFKTLTEIWNKKLEDSGFNDAEIELKGDRALKQRATNSYRQASELERESRLEYYSFLGYLAHNTKFLCEIEKFIMIRHSEGAEDKEIVEELKNMCVSKHRQTVSYIIKRWQVKWGVKNWSLRQRNLRR